MASGLIPRGYKDQFLNGRASARKGDALSRAFRGFYRCPDGMLEFALKGKLSAEEGYFRVGPNVIGYGRSSLDLEGENGAEANPRSAKNLDSAMSDILGSETIGKARVELPFDPTEIIENLRLERYPHRVLQGWERVLKRIYYGLRPVVSSGIRKKIQRFNARRSRNLPFPQWPVDTTVENICETILLRGLETRAVDQVPFVWFWPRGDRGCVVMTHDVETAAGREFCGALLDIDDSFGIKASFQIVPEERYPVSAEFLNEIRRRGFEVALHDLNHDGRLFDSRGIFLRRAARIRDFAKEYGACGFRSAILYRKPEWLDELGFSYDMSTPNVAHLDPQDGGCCTVMPYFIGKTLELPVTTVQDYSLFHILDERSIDLWSVQTELILKKNGMVSFIVHPDYVIDREYRQVYEELLSYLRRLRETAQIWFALPREVNDWWRKRSRMSVVKRGASWQIEGEGSENAVLAFASSIDGRLTYQFANETVTV